jgi:hypothetical protein
MIAAMSARSLALACLAIAFAGTAAAAGGRVPRAMPGNVCVTQLGWCDLPGVTAPIGYACVCLTADNTEVPGVTRHLAHTGPFSPYLRPYASGSMPTGR